MNIIELTQEVHFIFIQSVNNGFLEFLFFVSFILNKTKEDCTRAKPERVKMIQHTTTPEMNIFLRNCMYGWHIINY